MTPTRRRLTVAVLGLVLVGIGSLLFKLEVLDTLHRASLGLSISYSEEALFFAPLAVLGGLMSLGTAAVPGPWQRAQGASLVPLLPRTAGLSTNLIGEAMGRLPRRYQVLTVVLAVAILAAGVALHVWFTNQLEAYGYSV